MRLGGVGLMGSAPEGPGDHEDWTQRRFEQEA